MRCCHDAAFAFSSATLLICREIFFADEASPPACSAMMLDKDMFFAIFVVSYDYHAIFAPPALHTPSAA